MGISACIIAKNEEDNIRKCLNSIMNIVDEIIFVDTGSTDNTVNIAKEYDCKIILHNWDNSFSKARNISLENATHKWILVIDCDEEVLSESSEIIKQICNTDENIDGFGVLVSNIIDNIESSSYGQLRIFRNRKEHRYEGIIHEQISDSIVKHNPNAIFLKSDVKIIHYGYENNADLQQKKLIRNISLLNLVDEKYRDGMYYTHLGAEYVRLNDLDKASEVFIKGYYISDKTQPFFPQLAHKLVECLVKNNNFKKSIIFCEDILKSHNDFRCIYFLNGISYLNLCDYENALKNLKSYNTISENAFKYPVVNYSEVNDIDILINQLENILGYK